MQLFEYKNSTRWKISELNLTDGRPVLLHLGDHLRVRDMYIDAKFHDFLERMKGNADIRIVAPVIYDSSQDELLGRRMIFNRAAGAPSEFARDIYNLVYLPIVDSCKDPNDALQIEALKKNLSYISVSAYSYGTSLLQQIGHVMAGDIVSRFDPLDQQRAMKAFDICRSVKAVALGCTSRLRSMMMDGETVPLRWDDAEFSSAPTVFSQMLFQMRHDRAIINALNSDEAIAGLTESETGIELRGTLTAAQIIDYTPPPAIKRVGYQENEEGVLEAKILRRVDELVHGDSSYSYMHERQGDFIQSQTIAMTPFLRAAARAMMEPDLQGPEWLTAMRSLITDPDQRRALVACRDASDTEIETILSEVEAMPEPFRAAKLRDYVSGIYSDAVGRARSELTACFKKSASFFRANLSTRAEFSDQLKSELGNIFENGLGLPSRDPA